MYQLQLYVKYVSVEDNEANSLGKYFATQKVVSAIRPFPRVYISPVRHLCKNT